MKWVLKYIGDPKTDYIFYVSLNDINDFGLLLMGKFGEFAKPLKMLIDNKGDVMLGDITDSSQRIENENE